MIQRCAAACCFLFIWKVVAKQGQVWGNQNLGSIGQVTNPYWFSYPGYSEMSIGWADPQINSNDFAPNPNVNVFEWLNQQPGFEGKVAIFGSWHAYKNIFNIPRSHLYAMAGASLPPGPGKESAREQLLRKLMRTTTTLEAGDVMDSFVQEPLLDYVKSAHPRVLFVGYGEDDSGAHWTIRSGPRQRPSRRCLHARAVGHDAVDEAVPQQDDLHHHRRPWPRQWS